MKKECGFGQFSDNGMPETRTRGIGLIAAQIKVQQTLALEFCVPNASLESEMIVSQFIVDRCHIVTSVRKQVTMRG